MEAVRLQQENNRIKRENTRLREENARLQEEVLKPGSNSDISFWQISQKEVCFTDHELGGGAWGRVTLGSFRGQKVAIKQLHSTIVSPHYNELVRREISMMAKVRHPNLLLFIAAVLDTPGRSDPLIITELLDTDLRNAYQKGKLASDHVRLSVLRDVAAALNYLHLQREPIIHRDVNSANVLLQELPDRYWRGKLSDFGSANLARFATTPGPGAIVYCAPEAFIDAGKQSPKLDVFSYGKLLCEVLTSQFPFPSEFPSILQSMARKWPRMHRVVNMCVDPDPAKRPSMSRIVDQLEQESSSGGREIPLTREIEDLKSKLMTKTDELNKAIKRNSELSFQIMDTTHQLRDKVDKINVLEALLKNRKDTIADLDKESSQTELVVEKGDVLVMTDACALPKRVAAIDFGTGFCSLAYTLGQDDEIATIPLGFTYTPDSARTPTAVLLKKNPDCTLKVVKFGSPAQSEISKLSSEALRKYLYFEYFKMNLLREAEVSRDMPIKSLDGKNYYLVEVVAFVLLHLKNQLMSHLSKIGHYNPSPFDFDWVVTVPAIWKARGKQMMREAASLAGLTSTTRSGINSLTQYGSSMKCPEEENPHKLTLALEPECAALYCQQLTSDLIAPYSDNPGPLSADSYMVCDLGAGTVDITAYIKHGRDDIEVIIPPTGNDCGGKEVNQQFYQFLEQIVNDDKFSSFCSRRMTNQAILTTIIFHDFEKEKQHFGMDASALDQQCDEVLRLELRHKFVDFYLQRKIVDGIKDSRVSFDKEMNILEIEYSKVREFFEPVVNRAIGCITNALMRKEVNGKIKMIYLLGGFGACKYFCSALRKAISSDIHIVVPTQYKLTVSIGAVLYRRNPAIIKARRMDASYGIGCSYPFDARVHDEAYAYRDPDTGVKKCRNVFSVFVKKGQKVRMTERFVKTVRQASVKAYIPFFTTTDLSVKYTKDRQGRHIVQKIGSLTLDSPNPDKLGRKNRNLEVTMDFSSTEIKVQARALYLPGQPSVKAVLDFL